MLVAGATLAGCAAQPGQPLRQTVRVETPACEAARCVLRNDRGQWAVARTPGEVEIVSSQAPLSVSCRADGAVARTTQPSLAPGPVTGQGAAAGAAIGGGLSAAALAPVMATPYAPFAAMTVAFGALAGGLQGYGAESAQRPLLYPPTLVVPLQCQVPGIAPAPSGAGMLGLSVRGVADGDAETVGAVLVTAVVAGAPAAVAGLQPGDLVTRVGGQRFDGSLGFEVAMRGLPGPRELTVRRNGGTQMLVLQVGTSP